MNFQEVIKKLNDYAPLKLGESWDNVGLLLEPPDKTSVSTILLTNDLTLDVMDEAEANSVDIILSYHPPIFSPLKKITTAHWKERIIGRCLAKGIAIYSPHTCYDALKGGVNDWLITAFGDGDVTPVNQSFEKSRWTYQVEFNDTENNGLFDTIQRLIKAYLKEEDLLVHTSGNQMKILCTEKSLSKLLTFMVENFLKTPPLYTIVKLNEVPISDHGSGRISELKYPISIADAVNKVKKHLCLSHVRLALAYGERIDHKICTVAVCAGSGATVLRNVKVDLILTGEMMHHSILEFTQQGISVILTDHSNSERGFLSKVLQSDLDSLFKGKVDVMLSSVDSDPLNIV